VRGVLLGLAILMFSSPSLAVDAPNSNDPILAALKPELDRSLAKLLLPDLPVPYYLGFSVLDITNAEIASRLGDFTQVDVSRNRFIQARMRVGDKLLDNGNFIGFGWGSAGSARLTVTGEDDPKPVVRDAWLVADAAYKQAVGTLAAKVAALKREQKTDRPPDFSPAPAAEHYDAPAAYGDAEEKTLEETARRLSAVFRGAPEIQRGEVRISVRANTYRLVDSDNFRHRQSSTSVRVLISGEAQAADGTPIHEVAAVMAPTASQLGLTGDLDALARETAGRLARRVTAAELADPYLGPILFSSRAAAEFVRQTLAGDVAGTPPPVVADDEMKASVKGGQLARFLGLRVLPVWMDLTDEPGRADWQGVPLLGRYDVDREGVPGKTVELIKAGRLQDFLMSRVPSKKSAESNGHGRVVAGPMARAAMSNLILRANKAESDSALLDRLLKMAREEGLKYAIVVRHLDEPSGGDSGPRRINLGTGTEDAEEAPSRWAISPALDVVEVDVATRKETPLRGVLFGPIGIAELRSIVAAGSAPAVYSYVMPAESTDYAQGLAEDTTGSVVSPALLFPQLEVRAIGKKRKPLPLLENPLFAKGAP